MSLVHASSLRIPALWLVPCTSARVLRRDEEEEVDSPGVRDRPDLGCREGTYLYVRSTNFSPALRHGCVCLGGRCAAGSGFERI